MKTTFLVLCAVFAAMYIGAIATLTHPKNDGIVHLRWATDANPARDEQIREFSNLYPRVAVAVDPDADDTSKVIVQSATGVGPDIVDIGGENMQSMVDAGVLLDLTPYAKKMGFDPSHTYPAIRSALCYKGEQYRFPCNVSVDCVIYNKKIFDDHNVPYPKPGWTEADFVRTAQEILHNPSKSGQQNLAWASMGGYAFYLNELVGRGAHLYTPDGLHSELDSPQSIASLQDYYNLMFVNRVIPTPADAASMSSQGGWGSGAINWFSSGKAAMIPIGRWYICQLYNYPNLEGHLGAAQLPGLAGRPSSGVVFSRAAGVNVNGHHVADSLKFLQYLASPEYSKIVVSDGDALPPDPALASSGKALVDQAEQDPAFHQAFVDAIKTAKPVDDSPYIDAVLVTQWIGDYVQKVENQIMTPGQALHMLTTQIDLQIRLNLERRPDLQKTYEQQTGKPYTDNWWKT